MIPLSQTELFSSKQIQILQKKGIKTVTDLFLYLPRRYVDRSKKLDLKNIHADEIITFVAQIISADIAYGRKRRLVIKCRYESFTVHLVFFQGINYYKKILTPGVEAAFSGKIEYFNGVFQILHPEIEILTGDEFIHTGKIIPLYKITDQMRNHFLTNRTIRKAMADALKIYGNQLFDQLDDPYKKMFKFLSITDAITKIHFPENMEDISKAQKRLAFDELIFFSIIMLQKKESRKKIKKIFIPQNIFSTQWHELLTEALPFKLTEQQQKAVKHLIDSAGQIFPFSVLLQGDVGSGKTIVALLTALYYLQNGIQVAVMAPTEILARQHYRNIINYFTLFPLLQTELLLSTDKSSEKKIKLDRVENGDTLLIIGTHTLIQEKVIFKNLGFVIIDEQHRFGVEQRELLKKKGYSPDFLMMSATPIPRSLTLTMYGDLEQLILSEKPSGRQSIETKLFEESELAGIYRAIIKYVSQGRQAYIVYPLIEETEKTSWSSLVSDYENLEKNIFQGFRLGLLHGNLSADEKEKAMEKFNQGLIQILVSTTVIEVGVDVPNATVMVIRNADKFGLSQLHQLRGRVGRGKEKSFCVLVKSKNITSEAEARLNAMLESDDGFYLAQKDFQIRGSGEIFNTRQAGISEFKIVDLRRDGEIAYLAKELVETNTLIKERIIDKCDGKASFSKGFLLFKE